LWVTKFLGIAKDNINLGFKPLTAFRKKQKKNKHNLPSKECIARILRNKKRALNCKDKFYFTYDNETLRSIFKSENDNIFKEYNFEVIFNNNKYITFNL
jgi:hypothetical protein